jgi:hypothetical protein
MMQGTSRSSRCGLFVFVFTGFLAYPAIAQQPRFKLQNLDAPTIRAQLEAYIQNPKNKQFVDPARAVADLSNPLTFEIGFTRGVPKLSLSFLATTDPPGDVKPVRAMVVNDFLGQFLLEEEDYQRLLQNPTNVVVSLRPRDEVPPPDLFQPPPGLVTPANQLLAMRGCWAPNCFPFTAANSFDLAGDCYRMGLYYDAIALLDHALGQNRQASYYYLKAMSELHVGRCPEAVASVRQMVAAQTAGRNEGLSVVMERYNGPLRARIDDFVKLTAK